MVRRILHIFHKELRGVHQAALLLASATIVSNILGLLRDRFLASTFGAGKSLDMYYASFRVPDFLYAISLFFAASTAIIPILLEQLREGDEVKARKLMNALFTVFFVLMTIILFGAYIFTPMITRIMLPGFDAESTQHVIDFSRVLLLSPLLLGLSNLVSSIIQSYRRFFVYALSPIFYNIGIIYGVVVLAPSHGLWGVVMGVVIGAFLHFAIQLPSLFVLGFFPRFTFHIPSEIRNILKLSFPRTLGLATNQLTFIVVTSLASTVGAGAIAIFNLSHNLQSIPLAVIGLSYSVAAFPTMAELIVKKEKRVFFEHLMSAARHIVFWTLPMAVLFIVLRAQIVRVILGAGRFDWEDTRLVAASLALFALGIVAQSLVVLFTRAFYAIGKTKTPVIINLISAAVIVCASYLFVALLGETGTGARVFAQLLRVADVPHNAVLGIPLAFAIGSLVNMALLASRFGAVDEEFRNHGLFKSGWDILVASFILGIVSYVVLAVWGIVFEATTFFGIFMQGASAGIAGIIMGALFLQWRNNQEYCDIWRGISQKFWKEETVAPEPEHLL